MEELFHGPVTYLDDVTAIATTTGGTRMANILEDVSREFEKEVKAQLDQLQLSTEKSCSYKNRKRDVAADCEDLDDAYNLLFEDGKKPVPIGDFPDVIENRSNMRPKTLDNNARRFRQKEDISKFKVMLEKNQLYQKENIPQCVKTNSMEKAASVLKKIATEGDLYAIKKYNGGMRSARITYAKDKLLLHRLRKKHPPSGSYVVYHSDVMKLVDTSSRLTFLEIGERDFLNFGKVFIRLYGNTLGARHFSCLCTGEMGPTYAGFTFVETMNENHKTLEYVRVGDYENCNGTGGKPLFQGLNENKDDYVRPWVAGTLEGCWIWKDEIAAQFDILMKDNPGRMCEAAFGIVEEGFRVLKGAMKESPCVEFLCVLDCGIVLPY